MTTFMGFTYTEIYAEINIFWSVTGHWAEATLLDPGIPKPMLSIDTSQTNFLSWRVDDNDSLIKGFCCFENLPLKITVVMGKNQSCKIIKSGERCSASMGVMVNNSKMAMVVRKYLCSLPACLPPPPGPL